MNWLHSAEVKVGLLVVVVGSLIAFMSLQVSDDPSYLGRSKKAWFLLPDANGLVKNSAIRSAGIPVGIIQDIRLQDGQARIDITVKSDIPLTTTATVEIKANGILGDKHVEIYPGSPTDPPLPDSAQILSIKDKGSLENLMAQVSEVVGSLKEVSKAFQEATSKDGTRDHILGRIVKNIETITADLAQVTSENKEKVGDIVDEVHDITASLQDVMNDQSEDGLKQTWKRLSKTMKNLDEITNKINKGEGTIGKLINDETTVDGLNTAIDGISGLLDTANRLQTAFDFRAEYLGTVQDWKSYVGIQIQPGLDRYYYVGIVNDPTGYLERTRYLQTGTQPSDNTQQVTYYDRLKFTILFAKNFWDWTFRGGMMESSGGAGMDYHFNSKTKLTLEAFNPTQLNVRSYLSYDLYHGIYVNGGINDAFNKSSTRSGFVGAGLFLTNDDIKLLLSRAPL